tara:strand:- start:10376 stop:10813 length:438 start_codon:yes stop_codon:yes gene_type:complete
MIIKNMLGRVVLVFTVLVMSCSSCSHGHVIKREGTTIRARITYYHPYQDKWGSQVADPKTRRAKEGITVAAHPDFSFGTKVTIPKLKGKVGDGTFIVQDRGSWVTKKKASKGKCYVFDVYVDSRADYARCKRYSEYMEVIIIKDK